MGMIPIKLEANTLRNVIGMRSMSVRAGRPAGRPAGRTEKCGSSEKSWRRGEGEPGGGELLQAVI